MQKQNKNKELNEDLTKLQNKIQGIKNELEGKNASDFNKNQVSGFAMGMRVITELVSGPIVGAGIGFLLDKLLNSGKVFLIIFILLGGFAGIYNVYKFARNLENNDDNTGE